MCQLCSLFHYLKWKEKQRRGTAVLSGQGKGNFLLVFFPRMEGGKHGSPRAALYTTFPSLNVKALKQGCSLLSVFPLHSGINTAGQFVARLELSAALDALARFTASMNHPIASSLSVLGEEPQRYISHIQFDSEKKYLVWVEEFLSLGLVAYITFAGCRGEMKASSRSRSCAQSMLIDLS